MTDQEEYHVGRAVAATILGQYRVFGRLSDNRKWEIGNWPIGGGVLC